MSTRTLNCRCGAMEWQVAPKAAGTQVVCYCKDCQAFDAHLGSDRRDPDGGTHIFQTLPNDVQITKGVDHLACLRLGPKGLLRWHAACCKTPIANTLPKPGLPFVGLILPLDAKGFGRVRARVNTDAARRPIKQFGFGAAGFAIMKRALLGKLSGRAASPFFDDQGAPVVAPTVISREDRHAATP